MAFYSTKTYTHAEGLSAVFRQWRADSHCRLLHGYTLEVAFVFSAKELDHRNWVMDFGGLKELKAWLHETFDHKTLVAKDDPQFELFEQLDAAGLAEIVIVDHVGCECFAKYIFDHAQTLIPTHVKLRSVEVREHAGNSAIYENEDA